jgi:hypothetical protein
MMPYIDTYTEIRLVKSWLGIQPELTYTDLII